jgi:LPS export ABC transporter protein LptC
MPRSPFPCLSQVLPGWLSCILLATALVACSPKPPSQPEAQKPVEGGATLDTVVLRRSDAQGRPLWRVTARSADLNQTRGQGQLQNLEGELFTDGKLTFKLRAPRATVQQQGEVLRLQGNLQVTDLQSRGLLTSTAVEWRSQQSLLVVTGAPKVQYPQANLVARQLQSNSRTREVIAQGQVVVDAKNGMRLTTEQLRWQTAVQKVIAGSTVQPQLRGVKVLQLTGPNRGSQLQSQELEWNLATQTVTARTNVQANLTTPQLEIKGEEFIWQITQQQLRSSQPLQVFAPKDRVQVAAQQADVDLARQTVQLRGNVQARGLRQQSLLTTNQLLWLIPQKRVEATGNVFYQQQQPRLSVRGSQAIGLLQSREVQVTGGSQGDRVVTEIIP